MLLIVVSLFQQQDYVDKKLFSRTFCQESVFCRYQEWLLSIEKKFSEIQFIYKYTKEY